MTAGLVLRPVRPLLNPRRQHRDLLWRQTLTLRRHDLIGIRGLDALDDRAQRRMSRSDRRLPRLATLKRGSLEIEPQSALLLVLPVAFGTALHEHRLHIAAEIHLRSVGGV